MGTAMRDSTDGPEYRLVTIGRSRMPPLRFKGVQTARYHYEMGASTATLTLWRCENGGFVLHLEISSDQRKSSFARRVESPSEGIAYLESLAAEVPTLPEPKARKDRRASAETLGHALLVRSRNRAARTDFDQMLSELSAMWTSEPPPAFRER